MRTAPSFDRLADVSVDLNPTTTHHGPESDQPWRRTVAWVVGAWALIAAAVVGVGWLLTHPLEGSVGHTDNDIARWFADQRTSSLSSLADIGTLLGETIVELVVAPIVAIAVSIWKRSWLPGLFVVLVTGGIGGFYYLGTTFDPRDRPPVKILDPGLVPTHSFPSGHVGTSVALYGSIVVLAWLYVRALRWWVTPLAIFPLLVLVARLYQGAHHLSDVLTSLVYGSVWLAVVALLILRDHPRAAKLSSA